MEPVQTGPQSIEGIWVIDKPAGPTSHDVVAFIRDKSKIQRVGHTGTLDPQASGVLVICVGKGTRLIEYLKDDKEYESEVELGKSTDTYDAAGQVTQERPVPALTLEQIKEACRSFKGKIMQVPPMVSAKRHQGKRLYELAREGKEVERKPVEVTVEKLEVLEYNPPVIRMVVVCTAGTYIRSLAHDLGEKLGCGAHLKALKRTRVGNFGIGQAVGMQEWEKLWNEGKALDRLISLQKAVPHLPLFTISPVQAKQLLSGRPLMMSDEECPQMANVNFFEPCEVVFQLTDGTFFAVGKPKRKIRGWILKGDKIFKTEL